MKFHAAAVLVALAAVTGAAADAARTPRLVLPLDVEAAGRTLYVADAGRHQILRLDLRTRKLTVFAGTGVAGSSGDGGSARRARLGEVASLAVDRAGNVYAADVAAGRVRRISRGMITTVARVPAAVSLSLHPSGRHLAIASIEGGIHRLELATGRLERLATADNPHGLAYLADGDLVVAEQDAIRRLDGETGELELLHRASAIEAEPGPGGVLYLVSGDPGGGAVHRLDGDGRLVRFAGTGALTPHRDRQARLRAGILPSGVEPLADGSVLVVQTRPVPAIRRIARGSATMTTLLRP